MLFRSKEYSVRGVVKAVSRITKDEYVPGDLSTDPSIEVLRHVAVFDVGTKNNIIRCLLKRGCRVTVFPQDTKAEDILSIQPDGIMITNGPGPLFEEYLWQSVGESGISDHVHRFA